MRKAAAIARRDLEAYFRSSAGALVLALFLALQGVVIWMFIRFLGRPEAPPGAVMEFFFGGTMLFWIAVALLATVIPMRLLSEETRTGTIEPLLTAPVTPAEVVLGKWAAACTFYAALWIPTILYVVFLRAIGAHLDPGPIAAGYLGTMLVGAALLAVGLLASSLTRNQVVAATLAFVATFILLLIGVLEGHATDPRWARLIRRSSLLRIMEDFGHGIVDSRHVTALGTLAVLALLGALRVVSAFRDVGARGLRGAAAARLPGWASALLVVLIAVMLNYIAGRHYVRGDWTRTGTYSVSPKTVEVLRALERKVEISVFPQAAADAEDARAIAAMVRELLERFRRYAPARIAVEYLDPDHRPERTEALRKKHGIADAEMAQGVIVFTSGPRSKVVTREDLVDYQLGGAGGGDLRLRAFKGEAAFLRAILTVINDRQPTVCFSNGHGEPDIESYEDGGYAYLAEELRRDALGTRAINNLAAAGVPRDCAAVVVSEPSHAFEATETAALDRYLRAGGRLLVMLGPVFNRDATAFARAGLEDFASTWGARYGDNLVVDPERAAALGGASVWAAHASGYGDHPIAARLDGRVTFWPRAREVRPEPAPTLTVAVLVRSGEKSWAETDLPTVRGDADLTFDAATDGRGPVPVAVAVEAKQGGARLAFLGTGQMVMNYRLGGMLVRDYNRDFILSTVAWLINEEPRVGVGPKSPEHVKLALEEATLDRAFYLFVIGLPLVALTAAGLVWYRRRY